MFITIYLWWSKIVCLSIRDLDRFDVAFINLQQVERDITFFSIYGMPVYMEDSHRAEGI